MGASIVRHVDLNNQIPMDLYNQTPVHYDHACNSRTEGQ